MKIYEDFHGFRMEKITLFDREAVIVRPAEGTANGKWALKTEYFDAFPDTEIKLLERGYHVAHIKNVTRWYVDEDNKARAELAMYMHEVEKLSEKCVVVGMSCGGMQGIYFASEYPQYVSCMYLDAPVLNYLSIPAGFGNNKDCPYYEEMFNEFYEAKGITKSQLLSFRDNPFDRLPNLVKHNIPVVLVSGDADTIVDFEENGRLLAQAYKNAGVRLDIYMKPGGDHHPHGLLDNTPIVEFLVENDK